MPRFYSGVPSSSSHKVGQEKITQLHFEFDIYLQNALNGIATFDYDDALSKLMTLNQIERATQRFRELFILKGNTGIKNHGRRGVLRLIRALKGTRDNPLGRHLSELERDNFKAEKMLLIEVQNELASPGIEQHQAAAKLRILSDLVVSCLNSEHRRLADKILERALNESPSLSLEGERGHPTRKRRGDTRRAQNQDAFQSPRGRGLKPDANQPIRAAFVEPGNGTALKPPSAVKKNSSVVSFARRINDHAHYLHSRYATLKPEAQHGLFRDITELVCEFAVSDDAKERPGESDAMAVEIDQLVHSTVGFLRKLDKPSRDNLKLALGILSRSSNPALARTSKAALSQMTPAYVLDQLPAKKIVLLLAGKAINTFVVTAAPFPAEEFLIHLKTAKGVKELQVRESSASNGAILYSIDGIHHYSNLATLVHKELKGSRGFLLLGENKASASASALVAEKRVHLKSSKPGAVLKRADKDRVPGSEAPVRIKTGTKFGKKQVGSLRISHLRSENGNEYIITNTQAKGGFGKFRYAVDKEGNHWGVKEFRSEFARHKRQPKTYVTNLDEIKAEMETMQKLDATCQVVDAINISGKVYAVMPIMSGEVEDVVKKISPAAKRPVARNLLRQMVSDLARCHKRGYIHRDVKLANALWNPDGKVAVSDFGLAIPRPAPPSKLHDAAGTPPFMAPEMFGSAGYDHKIDTWSLALAVAGIHVDWWESPFLPPRHGDRRSWATANFENYRKWRSGLFEKDKLNMNLVGTGSTPFDAYFRKLKAADHELCWLILNRMLVVEPSKRASSERIGYYMKQLQPLGSPGDRQAERAFAALDKNNDERRAAFALLEKERRGML